MIQYHDLLKEVFDKGYDSIDRTQVGTRSYFGLQARYNLQEGFPLLTTKKVHFKSVVHELIWFLKGETNISYLKEKNVRIWDEWADANGNLGPVYGKQWRKWEGKNNSIDQIELAISTLIKNPESRRIIVNSWNVSDIDKMALPPCHAMFQFYSRNGDISCHLYQRSADLFLGVPFNIASYALLTHLVGQVVGLKPKEFIHTIGDAHIYFNHFDQVKELLSRDPNKHPLPNIELNPLIKNINEFKYEDIKLVGYESYPTIKANVAI